VVARLFRIVDLTEDSRGELAEQFLREKVTMFASGAKEDFADL
jgi:hypothetical protein